MQDCAWRGSNQDERVKTDTAEPPLPSDMKNKEDIVKQTRQLFGADLGDRTEV